MSYFYMKNYFLEYYQHAFHQYLFPSLKYNIIIVNLIYKILKYNRFIVV